MNEIITHEITVNNWTLTKIESQPEEIFVEDLFLAKQLQYKRPTNIRILIKRLIDNGDLKPSEVCIKSVQTTAKGGRPGQSYFLSESGALKVAAHSETPMGKKLLDEVINVFLMAKRGQLTPPQQQISTPAQVKELTKEIVKETIEALLPALLKLAQTQQAPQLQNKPALQPSQSQPMQPELFRPAREMRWYQVFDICRDLDISVAQFWELFRSARCSKWQCRQQQNGRWVVREDALRMIEVQNDYR